jgi:hypothetical protein
MVVGAALKFEEWDGALAARSRLWKVLHTLLGGRVDTLLAHSVRTATSISMLHHAHLRVRALSCTRHFR